MRACDIKKIADVVRSRVTLDKFSKVVSRDEIRANDYNLNIPRYVDSSEKAESWDIYASMFGGIPERELRELQPYWDAFPRLKSALFVSDNAAYCHLSVDDLQAAVFAHPDVSAFIDQYRQSFADFEGFLESELIDHMTTLNIAREETVLSDEIFTRLRGIPLIDRYNAYQHLDEAWQSIAIDLEIIQTEGLEAIRQVDPNMVVKKKNGKDQETQEGWMGHVLSFSLVQDALLSDSCAALQQKEDRLSDIASEQETLLDELSEEDKEADFVNEAKDAFIAAEIKKALKAKTADLETLKILRNADALITEEKSLKKQVKKDQETLHLLTKETIEALSDEEAVQLIKRKWIVPILASLTDLPNASIHEFIAKLEALCQKYETTCAEIEDQIRETEQELNNMLDELTGNEFDIKGIAELKKLLGGE